MDEKSFIFLIIAIATFSTYTSFLYLISKEKGYLYYFLSNVTFIIIWIIAYEDTFRWINLPSWHQKIIALCVFLHTFFYVYFLVYYLDLSIHFKRLKTFTNYFILCYAICLSIFLWTPFETKLVFAFSIIVSPLILIILKKSFKVQRKPVLFVIGSISFLLLGNIITVFSELNFFPKNQFTSYAIIYGVLMEVILQSIGLGYHYKKINELLVNIKKTNNDKFNTSAQIDIVKIKDGKRLHRINISDIKYIQAADNYCHIELKLNNESILIRSTLKKMETNLPKDKFIRCHRSYIVSADKITSVKSSHLIISDKKIPIGKRYAHSIINLKI